MALHIDHITPQGHRLAPGASQGQCLAAGTLDGAYPLELRQTETDLEVRISGETWLVWDRADHDPATISIIRGMLYAAVARYREAGRPMKAARQELALAA